MKRWKLIRLDPLPYLGLARGYSDSEHGAGLGTDAPNRGRDYALKALDLDSTLGRGLCNTWPLDISIKHGILMKVRGTLKHAIELNPNDTFCSLHILAGFIARL